MAPNPYQRLYIYEIAGDLDLRPPLNQADFLGCWREGECSYLFFTTKKEDALKAYLGEARAERYLSETILDYQDWEAGEPLVPLRVGGFYLCPLWEPADPAPGDRLIRIDPGVAFGSGFHPTTKMCLELINYVYSRESLPVVLDLGTGTGILALACAARGAQQVKAVDNNNLALATAAKNIRHNQQEAHINLVYGDVRDQAPVPADLAVANLYYGLLRELLAGDNFLNKRWYIFSGLIGTEVNKFLTQMQTLPLKAEKILDANFWFAILARNII